MAPTQITVLYPNTSDATFDMDYYLSKHMPMVGEELGPYNFKGYSVCKIKGMAGRDDRGGGGKFKVAKRAVLQL